HARDKSARLGTHPKVEWVVGDGHQLPFEEGSFDAVSISFGVRNFGDTLQGLKEMRRILREGAPALILEFSLPKARWFRGVYLFYLRRVLPRIGGFLSGDGAAYHYLNQ